MPTVVHVCSDVYSSEVPAGTNLTHTPPLIRISSLSTCIYIYIYTYISLSLSLSCSMHYFVGFVALCRVDRFRINKNKNLDDLCYALHRWFPLETWFLTFLMARTVTEFLRVCHCFAISFAALGLSRQSHQQKQEYR